MRIHKKSDSELEFVQIFGERNSGTNHLRRLVEANMHESKNLLGAYRTKTNPENTARRFGYKHYYANQKKLENNQSDTLFIVIYKNPYTWIRSTMAKPYHFKKSLERKTIEDLADLRLMGTDIHGRPIPDVHPDTGENVNIFELRHHKIRNWESLIDLVDNVVYINYERLLLEPTPIVQKIFDNYGSLFSSTTAPEHTTDSKYLEKYVNPEPFSEREMEVMNANLNWESEKIAGYNKNNFFIL